MARRELASSPLTRATYDHAISGFLTGIEYDNGAKVRHTYDKHRLASIDHWRNEATDDPMLKPAYEYDARDLPTYIHEYIGTVDGGGFPVRVLAEADAESIVNSPSRSILPQPPDVAADRDPGRKFVGPKNGPSKFGYGSFFSSRLRRRSSRERRGWSCG